MERGGGDFPMWGSKISKPEGCGEAGGIRGEWGEMAAFVPAPPQDSMKRSPSSLIRHGHGLCALIGSAERADVPAAAGGLGRFQLYTLTPQAVTYTHAEEWMHTHTRHRTVSYLTNTISHSSYTRSSSLAWLFWLLWRTSDETQKCNLSSWVFIRYFLNLQRMCVKNLTLQLQLLGRGTLRLCSQNISHLDFCLGKLSNANK